MRIALERAVVANKVSARQFLADGLQYWPFAYAIAWHCLFKEDRFPAALALVGDLLRFGRNDVLALTTTSHLVRFAKREREREQLLHFKKTTLSRWIGLKGGELRRVQ